MGPKFDLKDYHLYKMLYRLVLLVEIRKIVLCMEGQESRVQEKYCCPHPTDLFQDLFPESFHIGVENWHQNHQERKSGGCITV